MALRVHAERTAVFMVGTERGDMVVSIFTKKRVGCGGYGDQQLIR